MLDAYVLFPVGGMRLFKAITIAVSISYVSLQHVLHSFIALTSLAWFYWQFLGFIKNFHRVCNVRGY